jgi:hypothetical protein
MGHGDSEKGRSLALDSSTRNELIDALGSYPRELQSVYYSNMKFPDSYYKFFLDPATMRTGEGQLRIYNKVGIAGGFISDVSFFHDQQTGLKFYLSGAIMAKKDGIPENGRYDYYDIGIPVFRKIGEILFQYLLATLPDDTD